MGRFAGHQIQLSHAEKRAHIGARLLRLHRIITNKALVKDFLALVVADWENRPIQRGNNRSQCTRLTSAPSFASFSSIRS